MNEAVRMMELNGEPSTRRWLPSHVYADEHEAIERMVYLISCYASPGDPRLAPYVLAVDHLASGALLGHVGFSPLAPKSRFPTPLPSHTVDAAMGPRLSSTRASGLQAASAFRRCWPSLSPTTRPHVKLWSAPGLFMARIRSCGFRAIRKRSVTTCGTRDRQQWIT